MPSMASATNAPHGGEQLPVTANPQLRGRDRPWSQLGFYCINTKKSVGQCMLSRCNGTFGGTLPEPPHSPHSTSSDGGTCAGGQTNKQFLHREV